LRTVVVWCLEALRLATTKLCRQGTGYPSWGHPTQLRISRWSAGLIYCVLKLIIVTLFYKECFRLGVPPKKVITHCEVRRTCRPWNVSSSWNNKHAVHSSPLLHCY
jgi:hypothetical protein